MINFNTALGQNFFEIAIRHGVADVEKDGMQDHGFRIVRTLEINRH